MYRLLLPILLLALLPGPTVRAQRSAGPLSGVVADSASRRPLAGAAVLVTSRHDTVSLLTNPRGEFRSGPLRDSMLSVSVTYLGYRGQSRRVRIRPGGIRLDTIMLGQIPYQIGEVVVKGKRPLMGQSGDTIIYHAENIRVLPGDDARQIVTRLPGIEVSEGSIKFMGKTVERTYVDGRPLFGENAQSALDYLAANEVIDVQVYEELTEEESIKGNANGKKRTVMNLITRSKPEKSVNIDALVSYGADIDPGAESRRKGRYGAGATYNYFSERAIYIVHANSNNNNVDATRMDAMMSGGGGGQGDLRSNSANASFTHRFGKKLALFGNYGYDNKYAKTQNITEQIYFPTSEYRSRTYRDTTRKTNLNRAHAANLNLRYHSDRDFVFFSPNIRFSRSTDDSYRGAESTLDGQTTNRVGATDRNHDDSYNLSGNLSWSHSFEKNKKRGFNVSLRGVSTRNDGDGWRVDSLSSSSDRTFLETRSAGWSRSAGGNIGYHEPVGKHNTVSANYDLSYENSRSQRMAVNRFTGLVDTTLTFDYTRNYTTHRAGIGFNRYTDSLFLSASLDYQSARLNKDEVFPLSRLDRHTFRSLQPSVMLHYTMGPSKTLFIGYNTAARQPSVEQLRNELDNQNRLSLTGGNPDLKQSYMQNFSCGFYFTNTKTARSYGINLNANLTMRDMATKRVFFTEDTPLPQYNNYVAVKGSTLTTPVNVNGSGSANLSGTFSTPVKPLGLTFNAGVGCGYSRRPTYIGETLDYTNSLSPNLRIGLQSSQSTVYQFSVSSITAYNHSSNSLNDDNSTITQNVGFDFRVNFLKYMYLNTNYNYYFYRSFTYASGDVNTNRLNLSLGCRLLKERQLDINFTAFDVLNRNDSFSSAMMSDYVTNSWSQLFGRYFSLNIGFKFKQTGKLKKGRKAESSSGAMMVPVQNARLPF